MFHAEVASAPHKYIQQSSLERDLERGACTFLRYSYPVRINMVDTMGGFRGGTGAGMSLECECISKQKQCSPAADDSGLSA